MSGFAPSDDPSSANVTAAGGAAAPVAAAAAAAEEEYEEAPWLLRVLGLGDSKAADDDSFFDKAVPSKRSKLAASFRMRGARASHVAPLSQLPLTPPGTSISTDLTIRTISSLRANT